MRKQNIELNFTSGKLILNLYQKTVDKVSKISCFKSCLVTFDNLVYQFKDGIDIFGQRNQSQSFEDFQQSRRHAAQEGKRGAEVGDDVLDLRDRRLQLQVPGFDPLPGENPPEGVEDRDVEQARRLHRFAVGLFQDFYQM